MSNVTILFITLGQRLLGLLSSTQDWAALLQDVYVIYTGWIGLVPDVFISR